MASNPKHCAVVVRPAKGRPVEIAVAAPHQTARWTRPIGGGAGKRVKSRFRLGFSIKYSARHNQQDNDEWNAKNLHGVSSFVSRSEPRPFIFGISWIVLWFAFETKGAQPGMIHRVVNAAWVVVWLPFCFRGCALDSKFSWRDVKAIKAVR
jgi:hypothetical protein